MPSSHLKRAYALFLKDLKSELRTRYAISAVLLFILTAISMIIFGMGKENLTSGLAAGILWTIMFFGAMTGLSRSFVSEEERGTSLLLKLMSTSGAVYFGKLLFNIILNLAINATAALLFLVLSGAFSINNPGMFSLTIFLGSIGIASAATIISAIIAKADAKGAIFPILSFPILLPLIIVGIETTIQSIVGAKFTSAINNFMTMASYSGIVITVSYLLFDLIWEE